MKKLLLILAFAGAGSTFANDTPDNNVSKETVKLTHALKYTIRTPIVLGVIGAIGGLSMSVAIDKTEHSVFLMSIFALSGIRLGIETGLSIDFIRFIWRNHHRKTL